MKWYAGCLIVLLIAACIDRTKVPKDIIARPKMEKIMWDMVQADSYVSSYIMTQLADSPSVKQEKAAVLYEQVFRLNHISRDEFLKSYKYYMSRPDLTKPMFDSIVARADRRRADIYKSNPRSSILNRRDSLLRADSLRKADSIEKIDLAKPSTEELFADSVLDNKKK